MKADAGLDGGANVGAGGSDRSGELAAVTWEDPAYSPSSPSSSTWSAQLGFELQRQVCGGEGWVSEARPPPSRRTQAP